MTLKFESTLEVSPSVIKQYAKCGADYLDALRMIRHCKKGDYPKCCSTQKLHAHQPYINKLFHRFLVIVMATHLIQTT